MILLPRSGRSRDACCLSARLTHTSSCPLIGLSFRAVVRHYAPKRHARYTPMPALRGVSFLCSERTTALQDPSLRCGEKPIPLRDSTSDVLPHSIPQPPPLARFA